MDELSLQDDECARIGVKEEDFRIFWRDFILWCADCHIIREINRRRREQNPASALVSHSSRQAHSYLGPHSALERLPVYNMMVKDRIDSLYYATYVISPVFDPEITIFDFDDQPADPELYTLRLLDYLVAMEEAFEPGVTNLKELYMRIRRDAEQLLPHISDVVIDITSNETDQLCKLVTYLRKTMRQHADGSNTHFDFHQLWEMEDRIVEKEYEFHREMGLQWGDLHKVLLHGAYVGFVIPRQTLIDEFYNPIEDLGRYPIVRYPFRAGKRRYWGKQQLITHHFGLAFRTVRRSHGTRRSGGVKVIPKLMRQRELEKVKISPSYHLIVLQP